MRTLLLRGCAELLEWELVNAIAGKLSKALVLATPTRLASCLRKFFWFCPLIGTSVFVEHPLLNATDVDLVLENYVEL